ncbi:hypothetical protein [Piscirickettsia litoralis]|uniref:Porin domain-containing protein n=1 Tax=Piscirickettsia litoralis TaxID=1891921 RepID=A0ABX3A2W6_9GAMM|nr:hypothetical protein [Piscirickettsia litoralis]ODN41963.1 hypothetical protein BGC07_02050 [Piscirickettsia litoralis]
MKYDSDFVFVSEVTKITVDTGLLADTISGYVTLGYRLGDFMPYINYARTESTDDDDRKSINANPLVNAAIQAYSDRQRNAYSLGLKYNLNSFVAIKADVTYLDDFGDTTGGLNGNLAQKLSGGTLEENDTVYSIALNAIF